MADLLATPEQLAAYLQKDLDTASATLALELATGVVQAAAGQRMVLVEDETVTLALDDLDGGPWLYLPEVPVVEVGAVVVGELVVTDTTTDSPRGRLYRPCGWRASERLTLSAPSTVTVTYTHGYTDTDPRLQFARAVVLSVAAGAYENAVGAESEQIDDYSVRYAKAAAHLEGSPVAAALRRRYGRGRRSVLLVRS